MRTNPYITRAILLGTAFAASSCMMGPDFKPVDMPMPAAFRGAPAATESIADLPWWKVFKNKDLQDLLTDTYNNNRDLKATMRAWKGTPVHHHHGGPALPVGGLFRIRQQRLQLYRRQHRPDYRNHIDAWSD